jgi:hypothetical protein
MSEDNYYEELSFGKTDFKIPDNYVIFHQIYGNKFLMNPGRNLVGISYDKFCGYLEGASLGKTKKEFYLFNGISNSSRGGLFPSMKFLPLKKGELEKLLIDTGLKKRFKIKTVR